MWCLLAKNSKGKDELRDMLWMQVPHQQEKLGRYTG